MPQRSDIMCYKAGACFELTLDISDTPDAIFHSATFYRGKTEIDWPLIEIDKMSRGQYRSSPDLLTLHFKASLPDGEVDDIALPIEQTSGQLNVKLKYNDRDSGSVMDAVTEIRVIPCSISGCDSCESLEATTGQS
jgi:hypothetical protein